MDILYRDDIVFRDTYENGGFHKDLLSTQYRADIVEYSGMSSFPTI